MSEKRLNARVAQSFIERAAAQGMKGKARDKAAVEFAVGAASAAFQMHGQESAEWSGLSALAFLVAVRGYEELERIAAS
jgi:hypothetical protein